LQWARTAGGSSFDYAYSVTVTRDGGVVVVGPTGSYGGPMLLLKFDAAGTLQWARTVGGNPHSVTATRDGGLVVAGYTGSPDAWWLKFDAGGTLQWAYTVGGANYDAFFSVIETSDKGLVLAGYTSSYGAGGQDMFVLKVGPDGTIPECSEITPVVPSIDSPSVTIGTPSPTVTSPSLTESSFSPTLGTFSPTITKLCEEVISMPKEAFVVEASGQVGIGTEIPQAKLHVAGDTRVDGNLDVDGAIVQRGAVLHADYVFEPDYPLESIEEHASWMWSKKHLPAIPQGEVDRTGRQVVEVGAHRRGIVEELEKSHIYIEQLNVEITELIQRLEELELGVLELKDHEKPTSETRSQNR